MQENTYKVPVTSAQIDAANVFFKQDIMTAAKGGGTLFIGQFMEQGSLAIFTVLVTRTLGAASYGLYSVGIGVALILATIAMLGLPDGMTRFIPMGLSERNAVKVRSTLFIGIAISLLISLVIAVIFFSLANVLAVNLFHEPSATPVLRLLSIIIPLETIGRVLLGAVIGLKRFDFQVYGYSFGFAVVRIGLTALFLHMGWDVSGVVIAYSLAWIITIGVLFYLINRVVSLNDQVHITRNDIREHVLFSTPLSLSDIMIQLRGYVDLLVISVIGTMTSVGVYSAAMRVQAAGNMLLAPIANIAKPIISDLEHQSEVARLGRLYQTLTRWSLSFMLPLVITIVLYPRPILTIFGDEFVRGVPVLTLFAVGLLINAATRICHSMVSMTGHSTLTFFTTFIGMILNLIFDIILIPRWGIVGSAVGTLIVLIILGVIRLMQVYLLIGLWPYNWTTVKPLLAAAIALLIGFLINQFFPATSSLFFFLLDVLILCSSYVVATACLGLSEEDHAVLSRVVSRLRTTFAR